MAYTGVEYLDTQKLLDAANKVDGCIKEYKEIIKKISTVTSDLIASWYGEGRKEFEKDYSTIYQQLTVISDIMYDLYDSLVDSDATFVETDVVLAQGL